MAEVDNIAIQENDTISPINQNKSLSRILRRKDICKFTLNIYTKIMNIVMRKGSLYEAIVVLIDTIQDAHNGKFPYGDFVVHKTMYEYYKTEFHCMKIFSDELKKLGKMVNSGDSVDFIVVEDATSPRAPGFKESAVDRTKFDLVAGLPVRAPLAPCIGEQNQPRVINYLGQRMRLTEQYLQSLNTANPERIDYNHYINGSASVINKLFALGFGDDIAKTKHISYKGSVRHKPIYLDQPVKMLLKMKERGDDLENFKEILRNNTVE